MNCTKCGKIISKTKGAYFKTKKGFHHFDCGVKNMSDLKLGETGEFPDGKMNPLDEGELQFAVATDMKAGLVYINFGKPVAFIAMRADEARGFGDLLIKHANDLSN